MTTKFIYPPKFIFEEYFNGKLTASGIIKKKYNSNYIEYLNINFNCSWNKKKDTLTILEKSVSSLDKIEKRTWNFKKINNNKYVGQADNISGPIYGNIVNNVFIMNYKYKFNILKFNISLDITDTMYLQNNNILINKTTIKKLGIALAEIILVYRK